MIENKFSRLLQDKMISPQRRTQRRARVAGCGLDKDVVERRLAEDTAIGHAVQHDATRNAKFLKAGLPVQMIGHLQQNLFGCKLNAGRHIRINLVLRGYAVIPLWMVALGVRRLRVKVDI